MQRRCQDRNAKLQPGDVEYSHNNVNICTYITNMFLPSELPRGDPIQLHQSLQTFKYPPQTKNGDVPSIGAIVSSFVPILTTENLIILGSKPKVCLTSVCVSALASKRM